MHPNPNKAPEQTVPPANDEDGALVIVPRPRAWRWVVASIALVGFVYVLYSFAASPNISWSVVGRYFTWPTILEGARYTVVLTVVAMVAGVVGGIVLAAMRLSSNIVFQTISSAYIWFFRGTPLLIQIIFWFNIAIVFPRIKLGIPFTDVEWVAQTNSIVTAPLAAFLALALNEAAYMAEIVRGGIISLDRGQTEASQSIGMRPLQAFIYIILPQTVRVILPATSNQFIGMLKSTSLVSVIAAPDLMTNAQHIYSQNYLTVELLIVASIWYLIMTTVATAIQIRIERRYNVSVVGAAGPSRLRRALADRLARQNP
jgi:polar amino acid transport system permease protein